jgi:transcriptional regulator NrdR family protein
MKVVKRNGSIEDFDPAKIERVVIAAGLSPEKALELSQKVSDSFSGQNEVSSIEIRDEVLFALKEMDQYAANMFDWYQKTKEKTQQPTGQN